MACSPFITVIVLMDSLLTAAHWIIQHEREIGDIAYGSFGLADFFHVVNENELTTRLKVAYFARGFFYIASRVLPYVGVVSKLPFLTACVLGIGLNTKELREGKDHYSKTKSRFGLISNIAYIIFTLSPHPATFSIAILSGAVKVTMGLIPAVGQWCRDQKPRCCFKLSYGLL